MSEIKSVLVYLGATMPANPAYVEAVRELGVTLARKGMTLVFGGSREGTMTVLADSVLGAGGHVVGVFTEALPREFLYEGLPETVVTPDLAARKAEMLRRADAVIALPGSFGTWDELFDALELAKIEVIHGRTPKPIGLLNVDGFYDGLLAFVRKSVETGYTTPEYAGLLHFSESVPELLEMLSTCAR